MIFLLTSLRARAAVNRDAVDDLALIVVWLWLDCFCFCYYAYGWSLPRLEDTLGMIHWYKPNKVSENSLFIIDILAPLFMDEIYTKVSTLTFAETIRYHFHSVSILYTSECSFTVHVFLSDGDGVLLSESAIFHNLPVVPVLLGSWQLSGWLPQLTTQYSIPGPSPQLLCPPAPALTREVKSEVMWDEGSGWLTRHQAAGAVFHSKISYNLFILHDYIMEDRICKITVKIFFDLISSYQFFAW